MNSIESCTILLGGVNVLFQNEVNNTGLVCENQHQLFINNNRPEFIISVKAGCPQSFDTNSLKFETSNWSYYRENIRIAIHLFANGRKADDGHYSLVLFPEDGKGELFLEDFVSNAINPTTKIEVPPRSLGELIAIELLSKSRGLMFHASGLKTKNENGLLMAGVSGAGKSTIAKLWVESGLGSFLGDECVTVLEKGDNDFYLQSTAWHGSGIPTTPCKIPLSHIFILDHSTINQTSILQPEEAVPELLSRAFLPFWNREGMEYTLQFLEKLCQSVPVYHLGFSPNLRAVDYIQCLISS